MLKENVVFSFTNFNTTSAWAKQHCENEYRIQRYVSGSRTNGDGEIEQVYTYDVIEYQEFEAE